MPDIYGNTTLRDIYPIFCDACRMKITTADYFVTGLYMNEHDIPVSRYAHRACLNLARTARTTIARPLGPGMITCLYCGEETPNADFICDSCRATIKRDLRHSEATEAVKELLRKLAEESLAQMRAAPQLAAAQHSNPTPPAPRNEDTTRANRERPNPARTLADMDVDEPAVTPFVPTNESGVIFMLGGILTDMRYRMVAMPNQYPDAVLYSPSGKFINVEFEFRASNFIAHRHDPKLCDLVICWQGDRDLPVPVLALEQHYNAHTGRWNFRDAAASTN